MDRFSADLIQSFLNVDTDQDLVCLAGSVRYVDTSITLNRRVTFSYDTIGPISKETDKKVDATFTNVNLTLDITEPRSPTECDEDHFPPNCSIVFFNKTIQVECKVKASLKQKDGLQSIERATDRVSLDCDLGPGFEAFDQGEPPTISDDPTLLQNVQFAYAKRKNVKADVRTGRLKIKTKGSEVLPEDTRNVPLICDFPD